MFKLKILTLEKSLFEGEARALIAPGSNGYLEILPLHAPLLTPLQSGTLTYRDAQNQTHTLPVQNGFLEVSNHNATVLLT